MIFSRQQQNKIESVQENNIYPFTIGLTRPAGRNIEEFLVVGQKQGTSNCENRIMEFFMGHGAEFVSHHGYIDENSGGGKFVFSCCVNIERLDCTLDELLIRLRKLKFVTKAERSSMKGELFTNFLFPTSILGLHRAVSIDTDSIDSLEDALREGDDPRKISKALFDEGKSASLRVCELLVKILPEAGKKSPESPIMESVKSYLRASGWGMFNLRFDTEFAFATIIEPPVSTIPGKAASVSGISYLSGFVAGIVEHIQSSKMYFRYASYESERHLLTLCLGKSEIPAVIANSPDGPASEVEVPSPSENNNGSSANFIDSAAFDIRNLMILEKVVGAAKRGSLKINLMHAAKLSHSGASSLLDELTRKGLLDLRKDSNIGTCMYYMTSKGEDFVELCQRLADLLVDNRRAMRNSIVA